MIKEKTNSLNPITGFCLIPIYIILDQLSKWFVLEKIFKPQINEPSLGLLEWITSTFRLPYISIDVTPFFNLSMVWNQGISFGLFQNGNPWPLIIVALLISTVFSVWLARTKNSIEIISLSLVIGGAIGNIIDRLHFGAVADFLDFYIGNWHYPAFNLADSFISVGIVILLLNSLFSGDQKDRHTE